MIEEVEQAWLSHIPAFPFHMSVGTDVSQFVIQNEADFLSLCYHNLNRDLFVAVNNIDDRKTNTFRTLYIDIDSVHIPSAYEEYKTFCGILDSTGVRYRSYFSGSKGFAIYIDFKPTVIKNMRERLVKFIDEIIDIMDFKYVDRGVCIDIHRISRLPYSVNTKSGKMCHPIADPYNVNIEKLGVASEMITITKQFTNDLIPNLLLEIELDQRKTEHVVANSDYLLEFNYMMKYCEHLIAGVRHHAVRLKIIPTLVLLGYDDKYIDLVCKEFFMRTYGKYNSTDARWVISQIRLVRAKKIRPILNTNLAIRYGINGSIGI